MLTDSELDALLDAHDALVSACIEERLSLIEFLAAYNDFPRSFGLDERNSEGEERRVLGRSRRRIAFHFRVLETVSGPAPIDDVTAIDHPDSMNSRMSEFLNRATLMRLRQLVARYPEFKTLPDHAPRAAIYSV